MNIIQKNSINMKIVILIFVINIKFCYNKKYTLYTDIELILFIICDVNNKML